MGGLSEELVATIIQQAERRAEEAERAAAEERRRQKELDYLSKMAGEASSGDGTPEGVPSGDDASAGGEVTSAEAQLSESSPTADETESSEPERQAGVESSPDDSAGSAGDELPGSGA
jgi:N utilization substance protein A